MLNIITFIICAIGMTSYMINYLYYPVKKWIEIVVCIYVFICQLLFAEILGSLLIFYAIGVPVIFISLSHKHFLINMILSTFGYLTAIIINYILVFVVYVLGITVKYAYDNELVLLIITSVHAILAYVVTYFVGKVIRTKFISKIMQINNPFPYFLLTMLCAIVFVFNIITGESKGYPSEFIYYNTLYFLVSFVIILISFFVINKAMIEKQDILRQKEEQEKLEEHTIKLEELYENMQIFKHNFKNILVDISYCAHNDSSVLKEYFYKDVLPSFDKYIEDR